MKRGCETQAAQCAVQGAGRDGGNEWREDPGRIVGRVRGASDDDQHLQELARRAAELFERGAKQAEGDQQKTIDELYRQIGQLKVERDFLAGQPAISRRAKGGR
jgi:hypothetical protein